MTLQENISKMTAIANMADASYEVARDNLIALIQSNRAELMTLGQSLSRAKQNKNSKGYVSTFDQEYVGLFMDSFRDVDKLMTKLVTTGPLPEEEFQSAALDKLGIEMFPQGTVCKYLMNKEGDVDIKAGDKFLFSYMNNYSLASAGTKFVRWAFPEKFYYDEQHGGQNYGSLYLHTPKESMSVVGNFWHEDIQAYGPHEYGRYHTETKMAYDELLTSLAGTYGRCEYNQTISGDQKWAVWPEWNASLTGKIFVTSPVGYIPFEELGVAAQNKLKRSALMIKTDDDLEYYVRLEKMSTDSDRYYIQAMQPKPKNVPTPTGVEFPNDNNPDGHEAAFTVGTMTTQFTATETFEGGMGTTGYACFGSFSNLGISWQEPLQSVPPESIWHPPRGVKQLFVRYTNDGQMLYNFDKFLVGNFGTRATTGGLDWLMTRFPKSPSDSYLAEYWFDWFNSEAKEFGDVFVLQSAISTPRGVEQAASLYAVKFALMKMMFGHASRLQIG